MIRGVVTGGHTGISNDMIRSLPALQVIAVNGVGTDAVDLQFDRERGIPVTATFGALTEDVADLAIGLILASCRQICFGHDYVTSGGWKKNPHPAAIPLSTRVSGKRVGIVGMGKVGRAIAVRAAAFGCPIAYTDLRQIDDIPHRFIPDLLQLARDSDILVLAAAADKAQGIINASVLDALGKHGYLINIARGKLVVEEEPLVVALPQGHPLGAHDQIELTQLNDQSFIMHSPVQGKYFYDRLMGIFASKDVRVNIAQYIDQSHTILSMVRAGLGVSILPASAQRFHYDNVEFRPLADVVAHAEMSMAWRPDLDNPAVTAFRLLALEHFANKREAAG